MSGVKLSFYSQILPFPLVSLWLGRIDPLAGRGLQWLMIVIQFIASTQGWAVQRTDYSLSWGWGPETTDWLIRLDGTHSSGLGGTTDGWIDTEPRKKEGSVSSVVQFNPHYPFFTFNTHLHLYLCPLMLFTCPGSFQFYPPQLTIHMHFPITLYVSPQQKTLTGGSLTPTILD